MNNPLVDFNWGCSLLGLQTNFWRDQVLEVLLRSGVNIRASASFSWALIRLDSHGKKCVGDAFEVGMSNVFRQASRGGVGKCSWLCLFCWGGASPGGISRAHHDKDPLLGDPTLSSAFGIREQFADVCPLNQSAW